jgi:hypothetical protein
MAPDDRNDRKPPKARAPTRDRDVLVPKSAPTPPRGVPVTPPADQDWTGDTDTHALAIDNAGSRSRDEDTPIGLEIRDAEAELRLRARVKETNTNVKTASTGITALRTEMIGHVERLDLSIASVKTETTQEIGKLGEKVEKLGGNVIGAMQSVNAAVSSLSDFQGVVVENQLQRSRVTFEGHAKVAAAEQVLTAKDQTDAKIQRRSFRYNAMATVLKILAAGGVVLATAIATHYAEHC